MQMLAGILNPESELAVWNTRLLTCAKPMVAPHVHIWDAEVRKGEWISGISIDDWSLTEVLDYQKYTLNLEKIADSVLTDNHEHDPSFWSEGMNSLVVDNDVETTRMNKPEVCKLCGKVPNSMHFKSQDHLKRLKNADPPVWGEGGQIFGHKYDSAETRWIDLYEITNAD